MHWRFHCIQLQPQLKGSYRVFFISSDLRFWKQYPIFDPLEKSCILVKVPKENKKSHNKNILFLPDSAMKQIMYLTKSKTSLCPLELCPLEYFVKLTDMSLISSLQIFIIEISVYILAFNCLILLDLFGRRGLLVGYSTIITTCSNLDIVRESRTLHQKQGWYISILDMFLLNRLLMCNARFIDVLTKKIDGHGVSSSWLMQNVRSEEMRRNPCIIDYPHQLSFIIDRQCGE